MLSLLKEKLDKPLLQTSNPYLLAPHSSAQIVWTFCLALIPILIASIVAHGLAALKLFSITLVILVGLQYCLSKRSLAQLGNAALTALLFAFLLPPGIELREIVLGSLIVSVLGQISFGGLGQMIFHPALVGYASLYLRNPGLFAGETYYFSRWQDGILVSNAISIGTSSFFAILVSGLFLISKRIISWQIPIIYFLALAFMMGILGFNSHHEVINSFIFLVMFFYLSYPFTAPVTKKGRLVFAILGAIMTASFRLLTDSFQAALCAIFILNAFVPILDRWGSGRFRI